MAGLLLFALLLALLGSRLEAATKTKNADAAAVLFSPPPGLYTNAVQVSLHHPAGGAIHYTTDGREPTTNSPVYREPLPVQGAMYVRARVFKEGQPAGPIRGAAYSLLQPDVLDFSSNLPLVVVNTFGGPIVDDVKRPAWMLLVHTNGGRASLAAPVQWQGRIGIELRGSSSRRFPKSSFGIELVEETTGDDVKAPLLDLPAESDWVLYGPYSDKSLMRDVLAYDLWEDMGHYSVRRRFVEVFLAQHRDPLSRRDYLGVYVLLEKIKQGKQRVNIAKLTATDTNEPAITGGYILKRDRIDANDNGFNTSWGITLGIEYPKGNRLHPLQAQYIRRWVHEFEASLKEGNLTHPERGYRNFLDVPTAIDYFWIVEMSKTIDGYTLSVFMHKDREGKLCLSPIWDRNLSFGNANYQDGDDPRGWYWTAVGGRDLWYGRLFRDPDFDQQATDRWHELRQNLFATSNLLARVDGYARLLDEAKEREFARWPRLGTYVWPNAEADARNRTYQETLNYLKDWITRRMDWLDKQFLPAPLFSRRPVVVPAGATLEISGTNGPNQTILYTLDGSDPRQPGGAPSPQARPYEAPIPLTGKVLVTARIRLAKGSWGPPTKGVFVVEESPLPPRRKK